MEGEKLDVGHRAPTRCDGLIHELDESDGMVGSLTGSPVRRKRPGNDELDPEEAYVSMGDRASREIFRVRVLRSGTMGMLRPVSGMSVLRMVVSIPGMMGPLLRMAVREIASGV